MTPKERADETIRIWREKLGITPKIPPVKLPMFPASSGGDDKNDAYWKECALLDETHLMKLMGETEYKKWFAEIDGFQYVKGQGMNFRKLSLLICEKIKACYPSLDNLNDVVPWVVNHVEPIQLPDPSPPDLWEPFGYLVEWGEEIHQETIML